MNRSGYYDKKVLHVQRRKVKQVPLTKVIHW